MNATDKIQTQSALGYPLSHDLLDPSGKLIAAKGDEVTPTLIRKVVRFNLEIHLLHAVFDCGIEPKSNRRIL